MSACVFHVYLYLCPANVYEIMNSSKLLFEDLAFSNRKRWKMNVSCHIYTTYSI